MRALTPFAPAGSPTAEGIEAEASAVAAIAVDFGQGLVHWQPVTIDAITAAWRGG